MSSAHCGVQSATAASSAAKFSVRASMNSRSSRCFGDQDVRHGVQQRHVGARPRPQMQAGKFRQLDLTRDRSGSVWAPCLRTAAFISRLMTGCASVVLLPVTSSTSASWMSAMELVIAPEPRLAARPATELLCQRRAQ